MKVQFELEIGKNKFTLIEDVETNADFFKKLSFYAQLPKVGPNGEDDLVLQYRVAQKQYEYYSIVSQKAQMEFKFGQSKEAKGMLFAKGWEPLYKSEGSEEGEESSATSSQGLGAAMSAGTSVGLGAQAPAAAKTAAPAATAGLGLGAAKTPTPAAAPTPAPAAAAPAVAANAANILGKFGLNVKAAQ